MEIYQLSMTFLPAATTDWSQLILTFHEVDIRGEGSQKVKHIVPSIITHNSLALHRGIKFNFLFFIV